MTYAALKEYCPDCGGWHPKFLSGCPTNPNGLSSLLVGMKVDPTSNKRGEYLTVWFKCPKCEHSFVLLKSNYCNNCGIKLSWE